MVKRSNFDVVSLDIIAPDNSPPSPVPTEPLNITPDIASPIAERGETTRSPARDVQRKVHFERSGYLAVMNRCVSACRLCAVLGCLHDEERSLESAVDVLKRLSSSGIKTVTFPPNTLLHAQHDRLLEYSQRYGLKPVLRIHPAIGVASYADAIADWIFQGGAIEAVFDEAWDETDLEFLRRLHTVVDNRLRALLIPSRLTGLLALVDALPAPLAPTAEILFPFSPDGDVNHLSCDEVHATLVDIANKRTDFVVRPSRSYDRPGLGLPSWFETEPDAEPLLKSSSLNPAPRISVIVPSLNRKENLINTLRHLQRQDLEADAFEVIIIDDGSDDGTFARIREHLMRSPMRFNLRYYALPRPFPRRPGDYLHRAGIARNFGVRKSTGDTLVFVDADVLVPPDFLNDVLLQQNEVDVVQYERVQIPFHKASQRPRYQELDPKRDGIRSASSESERVYEAGKNWSELPMHWRYTSTSCLAVRRAHFLAIGGFARSFRSYGMEDMFLGWQLAKLDVRWRACRKPVFHLRPSDELSEYGHSRPRKRAIMARSARNFYLLTLDEGFYHAFFPLLGRFMRMRASVAFLGRFRFGRALLKAPNRFIDFLKTKPAAIVSTRENS